MKISPAVLNLFHAYRRPEQTQQELGRVVNASEMLKTISMPAGREERLLRPMTSTLLLRHGTVLGGEIKILS
jgi:hypothetical protein